ncbi:Transcription repressor OFP17 [Hirschfeldia incana]|nr:Transcription repressor OFP17 [Hirschfeldia incana]
MTFTPKDVNPMQHNTSLSLSNLIHTKTKQKVQRGYHHTTTTTKSFNTMRVKATLDNFKSKLSKSCNRFASLFRFRVKRPVFIRPLRRARHGNVKPRHQHHPEKPSSMLSCLCFLGKNKDLKISQTKPFSVKDDDFSKLTNSPLTPAAAKKLFTSPITTPVSSSWTKNSLRSRETFEDSAVEDACKSFENYLTHLIAEEGTMDEVMDIEELLLCWKNLKSPVFIELVSRFYGELCRDLFSGE